MKRPLFLAVAFVLFAAALPGRADLSSGVMQEAAAGDRDALHVVFRQSTREPGGAASMPYAKGLRDILQAVGNARFTSALRSEPAPVQRRVVLLLNLALSGH